MSKAAKLYITAIIAPGAAALLWAVLHWSCQDLNAFAVYLAIALLLSVTRLKLPGLEGSYSLAFLPVLYGLSHFTASEVLIATALSAVTGSLSKTRKQPGLHQILFNAANLTLSAGACLLLYSGLAGRIPYLPATLCVVVALYFAVNTLLVSGVLSLVQGKPLATVCEAWYFWSFVYYLAGAMVLGLAMSASPGVQSFVILVPIVYLIWFFWRIRSTPIQPYTASTAEIPFKARLYIRAVAIASGILLVAGFAQWSSLDPLRFAVCVMVAAVASCGKVRVPGMTGTISTNFVIILFAASEMQWAETMVIGAVAAVVQSYWKARNRPQLIRVVFNAATVVLSASAACLACHSLAGLSLGAGALLASVMVSTAVYYACNTALICIVVGLVEHKSVPATWATCRFWSLPYHLVGTTAAGIMVAANRASSFYAALLVLSVMALVFLAFRAHVKESQITSLSVTA